MMIPMPLPGPTLSDEMKPPFHREVRHLQVVEIVVKNFSMMGCDQGADDTLILGRATGLEEKRGD